MSHITMSIYISKLSKPTPLYYFFDKKLSLINHEKTRNVKYKQQKTTPFE